MPGPSGHGLDPAELAGLRALGHRMLETMFDHLAGLAAGPVWRPMPPAVRAELALPLAADRPIDAEAAWRRFQELVLPYHAGNAHPRFMGWVQGGGTALGMLAEMLAGGLNANCGGRDHAAIAVERQVIAWAAAMLGLPEGAGGVLVTGSSIANFMAALLARNATLGAATRAAGLGGAPLTAYAQEGAHRCVADALDMAGIGHANLRRVPPDTGFRIDPAALAAAIAADRAAGFTPFLVVGTAGSVDVGAVDDLAALAALCHRERLWFHVDAAFGAFLRLSPALAPLVAGIEAADSIAFDFHKWAQAPYDAGCLLARRESDLLAAFSAPAAYLDAAPRGLAAGSPWPCDLGPDLSRGFRALKIWLALQVQGTAAIADVVERSCAIARHLAARIAAEPALELLAPVALNIVCFRHRGAGAAAGEVDGLNAALVADLQEAGIAAPSLTTIGGARAIRAAFVNHRTRRADADALVDAVLAAARARGAGQGDGPTQA